MATYAETTPPARRNTIWIILGFIVLLLIMAFAFTKFSSHDLHRDLNNGAQPAQPGPPPGPAGEP